MTERYQFHFRHILKDGTVLKEGEKLPESEGRCSLWGDPINRQDVILVRDVLFVSFQTVGTLVRVRHPKLV